MTDINELVQEFWRTSSDGSVGVSFYAVRRLLGILDGCSQLLPVCSNIISFFGTAVDLADKNLQMPNSFLYSAPSDLDETEIRAKFKILFDGYRKMLDQLLSKSKDLGDMLRSLPGVVVQKHMSMHGMADLYRINWSASWNLLSNR